MLASATRLEIGLRFFLSDIHVTVSRVTGFQIKRLEKIGVHVSELSLKISSPAVQTCTVSNFDPGHIVLKARSFSASA